MTKTVKAVYPGSFDPVTLGHVDIIKRALKIFGTLTVLVADNSRKQVLFSAQERKDLLQESLSDLKGITIDIFSGLTMDYAKKSGAGVVIRGLRAVSDFEYELSMATMNRKLNPDIETLVIMSGENFYYIASNTVKEVALFGGNLTGLVPEPVIRALKNKLLNSTQTEGKRK